MTYILMACGPVVLAIVVAGLVVAASPGPRDRDGDPR